jgi:AraC-like DNA-binding protein
MIVSPFDLLILLGSLQGVILAVLLWRNQKGNPLSNRLLAGLMALLALACFSIGIPIANQWISLMIDVVPLIIIMPVGPIVYFYTKSLLAPSFKLGRKERLQFLPVVLDIAKQGIVWVYLLALLTGLTRFEDQEERGWWGDLKNGYDTYVDIPYWISLTVYLWLAQRLIRRHKKEDAALSVERQHHLGWLESLLKAFFAFQFLWLLFLIPYVLPAFRNQLLDKLGWYPLYVPLAGLIYWIGLRGYLHSLRTFETKDRKTPAVALPSETAQTTLGLLQKAMREDSLYLDADLSVEKVGKHLGVPAKTISAVLNQHLGKSFNAFINEYRVEAVKRKLLQPTAQSSTILGVAFDCGFNSQATFQRAFRSVTGQTPKEYLESVVSEAGK